MRARRALALALALAAGTASAAEPALQPYQARYRGAVGLLDTRVELTRLGRHLRFEYRSQLAGRAFYECSVLATEGARFWPLEYLHREIGGDGRRDLAIAFEPERRRVIVTRAAERETLEAVDYPVWDALSVQLRMRADLAAGRAELHYRVAEKNGIRDRRFRVVQRETVHYAGQEYAALRIAPEEANAKSYVTLAPQLHYLPVVIGYNARLVGWVTASLQEFKLGEATARHDGARPRCAPP